MKQQIIRSHRDRVKQANEFLKNSERYRVERISIFDREAFVEFFLLEDILSLYKIRLQDEESRTGETRAEQMAIERNMTKFKAIVSLFNSVIGVARAAINSGEYSLVWKAIPEYPLMMAANSTRKLPQLREMAATLLQALSDGMMEAGREVERMDEDLDNLESHEANVRKVTGLPSMEEIEAVIQEAERAIPDPKDSKTKKSTINPNL